MIVDPPHPVVPHDEYDRKTMSYRRIHLESIESKSAVPCEDHHLGIRQRRLRADAVGDPPSQHPQRTVGDPPMLLEGRMVGRAVEPKVCALEYHARIVVDEFPHRRVHIHRVKRLPSRNSAFQRGALLRHARPQPIDHRVRRPPASLRLVRKLPRYRPSICGDANLDVDRCAHVPPFRLNLDDLRP